MPARERVAELVAGARRIADAGDPLGERARQVLPTATGLSRESVDLALRECLEWSPSEAELSALCASTASAPRVHVLLSANVFVAAHRAIALALSASEHVCVRSSRREPEMTALLAEAAPGLFARTEALDPRPGEHVHAYGSDETLAELARDLPRGTVLFGHGAGFAALVAEAPFAPDLAARIAFDVALFDQRGCLSPRVLVVRGSRDEGLLLALARELEAFETRAPRGALSNEELGAVTRYRDTLAFAGELVPAGAGAVSTSESLCLPPVGRHLHVVFSQDPVGLLEPWAPHLTALGVEVPRELEQRLESAFGHCRMTRPGRLQKPLFDGPVDRRTPRAGRLL